MCVLGKGWPCGPPGDAHRPRSWRGRAPGGVAGGGWPGWSSAAGGSGDRGSAGLRSQWFRPPPRGPAPAPVERVKVGLGVGCRVWTEELCDGPGRASPYPFYLTLPQRALRRTVHQRGSHCTGAGGRRDIGRGQHDSLLVVLFLTRRALFVHTSNFAPSMTASPSVLV